MAHLTRADWHYIIPRCLIAICGALCLGHAERFTMISTLITKFKWTLMGCALLGFSLGPSIWAILKELWHLTKCHVSPRPPDG